MDTYSRIECVSGTVRIPKWDSPKDCPTCPTVHGTGGIGWTHRIECVNS